LVDLECIVGSNHALTRTLSHDLNRLQYTGAHAAHFDLVEIPFADLLFMRPQRFPGRAPAGVGGYAELVIALRRAPSFYVCSEGREGEGGRSRGRGSDREQRKGE